MIRRSIWIVVAIGFGLAAGAAYGAGTEPQYVGGSKCKTCHKKELIGDQYGAWQKAKHSQAFETLKGEKALEVAKAKGVDCVLIPSGHQDKSRLEASGVPVIDTLADL